MPTDEQNLSLYRARDEQGPVYLQQKYGRYCLHIAQNILGNWADAQECVNDAYLALWEVLAQRPPACLQAFVGGVVRNLSCKRYRHLRAQKCNAQFDLVLEELAECVDQAQVEQAWEAAEAARAIDAFLHGEKPAARCVFVRRYWYADSIEGIARALGMSQSKVKSTLYRMRKRLRTHLQREGFQI